MHRDTQILNAGYRPVKEPGPMVAGPQFVSTYVTPGDPAQHRLTYGRFENPTWQAWEESLGVLEGGDAVSFASGMAATSAVLGTCLGPGDTVVLPEESYYTIRTLASTWLEKIGVRMRLAPTRGNGQANVLEGARLLWLETPSNPHLDVCDIAALVEAAHAAGAVVVADNTTATGYLQQPLALGADYVVASDTKAVTGHADIILGHVASRDRERVTALRDWRTRHGAIPGPMEVWLAHRSLATMPLRVTCQCAYAARLASMLSTHPAVTAVHYPGLATHPGHEVAKRQMRAFGGVVSFELPGRAHAERFLGALRLVREATSFGGVHSTAERRARWGGDAIGDGFIRFSVGCEAAEDILEDVEEGLRAAEA
ncbi:MAG: cystathionine gamma-lyase [Gemmatimonadetes bacterium]|nr:cystathionine gamma-lyase [Gemmatimonadota bacterium]